MQTRSINTVGGLRLPKVLKNMIWQCFPSEICEQVSLESGCEYARAWSGRSLSETKGDYDEGQGDHEAVRRKASAWQQKRWTDLKMKRQIIPRRITIELLINVKGMNVILHGLRSLPINRWTVLLFTLTWHSLFASRLYLYSPSNRRYIYSLLLWIW